MGNGSIATFGKKMTESPASSSLPGFVWPRLRVNHAHYHGCCSLPLVQISNGHLRWIVSKHLFRGQRTP